MCAKNSLSSELLLNWCILFPTDSKEIPMELIVHAVSKVDPTSLASPAKIVPIFRSFANYFGTDKSFPIEFIPDVDLKDLSGNICILQTSKGEGMQKKFGEFKNEFLYP